VCSDRTAEQSVLLSYLFETSFKYALKEVDSPAEKCGDGQPYHKETFRAKISRIFEILI
jgi:hypothetical protein